MIFVPEHKKNSKIGEDIRLEKGNHVIILREGNSLFLERLRRFFFSRSFIAATLVVSTVLYTSKAPFLKAETTIFYPKACLGGFEGVKFAEGEPETKVDSDSSAFDKDNSAYLSKDQSAEMYCGNFDGEVLEHTTPKDVVLTIFLGTRESTEPVIKSEIGEIGGSGSTFLEVLDAKGTPTLENGESVINPVLVPAKGEADAAADSSSMTPVQVPDVAASVSDEVINQPFQPAVVEEEVKVPLQEETPVQNVQQSVDASPEAFLQKLLPIAIFFSQKAFAEEVIDAPLVSVAVENNEAKVEETVEEKKTVAEESVVAQVEVPEVKEIIPTPEPEVKTEVKVSEGEQKNAYEVLVMPKSEDSKIESLIPKIVSESPLEKQGEIKEGDLLSGIIKVLSNDKISSNNSSSTEHPLYEIAYSLGGDDWTSLANLGKENTKTVSLQLSGFSSWSELNKLQVRIKSLGSLDQKDNLYLDGMALVVHYEKDVVTEREYIISDIENTTKNLTVSTKGEKGEAPFIVMIAKEESGLAIYNLDTKALVLTTEVSSVNESFFDPNALFPDYGSYALVLNKDAGWCAQKSLKECLQDESFTSLTFLTLAPNLESKESKRIKDAKESLKASIALPSFEESINLPNTESELSDKSEEKESNTQNPKSLEQAREEENKENEVAQRKEILE